MVRKFKIKFKYFKSHSSSYAVKFYTYSHFVPICSVKYQRSRGSRQRNAFTLVTTSVIQSVVTGQVTGVRNSASDNSSARRSVAQQSSLTGAEALTAYLGDFE